MALTSWREPVDLTNDPSGDDAFMRKPNHTPVPLPDNVRHLFPDTPTSSRPKHTRAPLPDNIRYLGGAPTSVQRSTALNTATPPMSPYAIAPADTDRRASAQGIVMPSGVGKQEQKPTYMPVHSGNPSDSDGTVGGNRKAEKRRKLSGGDEQRLGGSPIEHFVEHSMEKQYIKSPYVSPYAPADGDSGSRPTGNGHAVGRPGVPNTNTGQKLQAMNGVPTVHNLNSTLQTNGARAGIHDGARAGIPAGFPSAEGRPLHIGRMTEETSASRTEAGPSEVIRQGHPAPESGIASGLDSMEWELDEGYEAADALSIFQPRTSPLKKRRLATHTPSEISQQAVGPSKIAVTGLATPAHEQSEDEVMGNIQFDPPPPPSHDLQATLVTPHPEKRNRPTKKGATRHFSTEEEHLLIFLKEVKKFAWAQITPYFPDRTAGVLQSHNCTITNRRDRLQDPRRLILPPEFEHEAEIDWVAVRGFGLAGDEVDASHGESVSRTTAFTASPFDGTPRRRRGRPRKDEQLSSPAVAQIRRQEPPTYLPPPTFDVHNNHESTMRHPTKRPRRNVQAVNYEVSRRSFGTYELGNLADEHPISRPDSRGASVPSSLEPSEAPSNVPDVVIPLEKPMDLDFEVLDAHIATSGEQLPYLSRSQQSVMSRPQQETVWDELGSREWQGSVFHVDFSYEERKVAEEAAKTILRPSQELRFSSRRKRLQNMLRGQAEPQVIRLSYEVRRKLPSRDKASVDAFLRDAKEGRLPQRPRILRLGSARPDTRHTTSDKSSLSSRIRQRELGLQSKRGWKTASTTVSYQTKNKIYDTLGPAYSFTGVSSDVHTVAWSPDGQYFAAGSVCVTDPDSMQYNRANNLLYGDLHASQIHELAEHRVVRPDVKSGPNASHAMRVTQDPKLYTTVSAVAFSPTQPYMFSAGYDNFACIWKLSTDDDPQPTLLHALKHKAEVDLLAVSRQGRLATAAKRRQKAIKVIDVDDKGDFNVNTYSSKKADERPDQNILPTALQFEPNYGRLLLAGFGANKRQDRLDINGDICLWDLETEQELQVYGATKNVFDVAFNPKQVHQPLFTVGCVASGNINKGTRSLLRFYDGRGWGKYTMNMEIECPALDMNDVTYCPYDENLVAAGCTSGRTYLWDIRRPDTYLYKLAHGRSLMPLDDYLDTEVTDTGIRFLSWGENAKRLYTGSSDGVVKVWDVARPQGEVFIKDLITVDSGIMSGAFSPDFSRLVLGEVNRSINVLEVGKDDYATKDMEKLKHLPYIEADGQSQNSNVHNFVANDSGRAIVAEMLDTRQMINIPLGGLPIRQSVQGPNYAGPFDNSVEAPYLREQALEFQDKLAQQLGPQCSIPGCKDSFMKVTSEEIGDSGRSADRIPDELRQQWKMNGLNLTRVPGKSKCAHCGRPARPLESVSSSDEAPLCERCAFACFRCGGFVRMDPATRRLTCQICLRVWQAGALGYECVQDHGATVLDTEVLPLNAFGKELEASKKDFLEANASFGDEMNALTVHYFALAIDRPVSPPL